MTAIIIIGIIIYVIYRLVSNKKPNPQKINYQDPYRIKDEQIKRSELARSITQNIKITVTNSNASNSNNDDSIIDVTNQSYKINPESNLKKSNTGVPFWSHQYVYSYTEIESASLAQKRFYEIYKNKFLSGEYLDLEGFTNYAFILLFDLLNEYDNYKDISKLEKELKNLGQYYPKTKSYGITFLIERMKLRGDIDGIVRLQTENNIPYYLREPIDYDTFNWRNKYKTKLNLNEDETLLLSKIWVSSNNFCNIEYCCTEILKLYISVIAELKSKYIEEQTTIDAQFLFVADLVARKHFRYKNGSQNYKNCVGTTIDDFYTHIYRFCENTVREYYGNKRKINTDCYYIHDEIKIEFETRIVTKVTDLLIVLISQVALPDRETEIQLYTQNVNRWKIKFDLLTEDYNGNLKEFIDSIILLAELNEKNPSIENIFFEASKFMAKHDKETALTMYVHYLYHDLKSATFDNKQLTKTIQKSLFKTPDQLQDFEIIINELVRDKDLNKALSRVSKVYEVKRKKVQLDKDVIEETKKQHSETVELLNEYLKDDFEENNIIETDELSTEEIEIEITQPDEDVKQSAYVSELSFTPIHTTALELFAKNNFSITQSEFEIFAKSKGVFKNQLIESINDTCYEYLDDVLIEEEDDYYTINTNYFQRISAQ